MHNDTSLMSKMQTIGTWVMTNFTQEAMAVSVTLLNVAQTMCMLQICGDVGYGKVLGWDIFDVHALPSTQQAQTLPSEPGRGNEGHWQTIRPRTRPTDMGEQPTPQRA